MIALFPEQPEPQLVHGQLYAAAAAAGMHVAQIAITPSDPADAIGALSGSEEYNPLPQRRAAFGGVMLAVLGGIWLLRRWLPGSRDD
ncbi:MAG: hypothetical protein HC822_01105 [Oscillochloris sp.]|nr:hypothetical protein [Oscillochloris sp.]